MRKNLYIILVGVTGILLVCIFLFSKKAPEKNIPSFKDRKGTIALSGEWLNSKKAMEGLLAAIEANPNDYKSMLSLSQAYIQEGRETGDHGYYDKAALELLDKIITEQPNNFDAMCCKATVLLSQHHFAEGLELAQKTLPLNPNSAFIYGILCDANLELGNYDNAVKMCDKMISVRPDIRSYSRVSYLREIYGDTPGAIGAIKMAVAAGYPGLEQTEWTRCILAHLYENVGSLDSAEVQYKIALQERPNYAFAIAGLGRIEKAKGNYKEAIAYYEKAKGLITEYSFSDELTDLYRLNGETEKANETAKEVINMLGPNANVEGESGHGHYADKELAYAYLKINDVDNALKHALVEYERRPQNIDVAETLAWVEYKKGEFAEANKHITTALKTNSQNPTLMCRAGLIKIKAGETEKGKAFIKKALSADPFIETELKKEITPYL
ncbi:MAG: tetratricopeptide repeat protein [Bacteroidetes bacterium]|nr:tetratricopeptide repeat protein [Bacteroidota bacterium]